MQAHTTNMTCINPKYVASLMHIHIAVARSLINQRNPHLIKSTTFSNEIVYHMYPTHSIKEGFEKYGLKNAERGVFVIIYGLEGNQRLIKELKERVS